jgi:hypothetical protein
VLVVVEFHAEASGAALKKIFSNKEKVECRKIFSTPK